MDETQTDQYQSGDAVTDHRSSSVDYMDPKARSLQFYENEVRRDPFHQYDKPTDRTFNSGEHDNTTSQPLLDQENETSGSQHQAGLTVPNSSLKPTYQPATPAESLLHREKSTRTLVGWPSSPSPIKTPIYIIVLNGLFDILLLACSIAFLAFALVVNIHDQHPTAENQRLTTALLNATKYGPTVFPILYAATIGRAAHAILLWRLEKGERIGMLDTLASSTSLTSTVTSQFQLRSLSIVGVVLLAVWSLSPIGGQASVRIMTTGPKDTHLHEPAWYMVNSGYLGEYSSAEMDIQGKSNAGAVFVAAAMGSPTTKASPLDLWGNVKIPRIEGYEGVAPMDNEGWYETGEGDVDAYSSLIGIPIASINEPKFIDYVTRVQSPYLSLQCSINTTVMEGPGVGDKGLPGPASSASGTGSAIYWDVPAMGKAQNSSQKQRNEVSPETASPLSIKYVPIYNRSNFTLTCNITQSYIEAEIRCPTSSNCASSRIRRSKISHFPPAWTLLDLSWRTLPLLFEGMLGSTPGAGKLFYPQFFDRYLSDPNLAYSNYANVSQTTEDKYTIRLGQMLNTYFTCLNGFFAVTAGINNDTAYFGENNQTFTMQPAVGDKYLWEDQFYSKFNANNNLFKTKVWSSDLTKTERIEVIVAHRGWVVALCLASIVLIAASLVAPFVHHCLTVGIDVAMNISSLATRDNPYMQITQTGSYLDASDRARLLRDHKVRFGEMEGAADVGPLVMGSVGGADGTGITRVRKGRLYE